MSGSDPRILGAQGDARGNGPLVLLVEDNEDNRCIYSTYLRYLGYRVTEVTTGEDALASIGAERPALVLMDVGLDGQLNGWSATERLKSDPATRDIPVIILTAHALEEDRRRASEVGGDEYLAKPVEPRAVGVAVGRMLARFQAAGTESQAQ